MVATLIEPSTAPMRRRSTRLRWISLPWTATLTAPAVVSPSARPGCPSRTATAVVVRGACAEDALSVRDMVRRCSPQVLARRFLAPVDGVDAATLQSLLATEVGFVARDPDGRTIGVGDLGTADPDTDPRTAELALLVEDAFSGIGLEQAMLGHLVAAAHLLTFRAAILRCPSGTMWAQRAFSRLGPTRVSGTNGDPRTIRVQLSESVMGAARGCFG